MKAKIFTKPVFILKTVCLLSAVVGFIFFLNSCRKEENHPITARNGSTSLQDSAYAALKLKATPEVFADLDWSKVHVVNNNGEPYLLQIPSKLNSSRWLFYNQKGNVVNTNWAQFTLTDKISGSLETNDLNFTKKKISDFRNGRIISSRTIDKNGESTQLKLDEADQEIISSSNNGAAIALKNLSVLQPETTETDPDPQDPTGGDPIAFSVVGPEAVIVGVVTTTTVDYYSLYYIMNNNPSYQYQFTTNPNNHTSIVTVTPTPTSPDVSSATPVVDSKPAIDPKKFVLCFTDGKTASSYTITIYVDQPVPGSNDQWRTGISVDPNGELFKSPEGIIDVGHTFLSFTKNNTDGTSVTQVMGFYPGGASTNSKGVIKDDGGHPYSEKYTATVTAAGFQLALGRVVADNGVSTYYLSNVNGGPEYNCTDAAIAWGLSGNMSLPGYNSRGLFTNTPGDYGQSLGKWPGASTTPGNAPTSHGPCN